MMMLPPAVIVHSLADVRAAMAPGRPVTLLSAPGAAHYAGCLWWRALLGAAQFDGPALLDCADAPGRALEALRLGLGGIVLRAHAPDCDPVFAQVAAIAAAKGALLLARAPPALDFGQIADIGRLESWLAG